MNREIVKKINESPYKAFITVAGGGNGFADKFLSFPGGSKTILGFYIPYDRILFQDFIGGKSDANVSQEGARQLAVASYFKACKSIAREFAIGIGADSSIATENERMGRKHKINVAVQTYTKSYYISYVLKQNSYSRAIENSFIEQLILYYLAKEAGIENLIQPMLVLSAEEINISEEAAATSEEMALFHGDRLSSRETKTGKNIILPGSFNPLHAAHIEIIQKTKEILGEEPELEMSIRNVDKPILDYISLKERKNQLKGRQIIFTNAPRFIDKIKVLTNKDEKQEIIFVMGFDTISRIFNQKYYVNNEFDNFINEIKINNVKFLVFSRGQESDENFKSIINPYLIKSEIAENFDMKISSSEIRKKNYV